MIAALLLLVLPLAHAAPDDACRLPLDQPFARAECCLAFDPVTQDPCLEAVMEDVGKGKTIAELIAAFEEARRTSPELERSCHPVVHAIGRLALQRAGGDIGQAFQSCGDSCSFGCMHGVMERLLLFRPDDVHPDRERMKLLFPSVCTDERLGSGRMKAMFNCHHGLGHAALFFLDYDLDGALALCDVLPSARDREWCASGVLMENLLAGDRSKRNLRADDPLYPCTAIPEAYRKRCASEQSRIFVERGWDDARILAACRALAPYGAACIEGFGRDISTSVRDGYEGRVTGACAAMPDDLRWPCVWGVIQGLIDAENGGNSAMLFCSRFAGGLRSTCFSRAGGYLRDYHEFSDERAIEFCAEAGDAAEECRMRVQRQHDEIGRLAFRLIARIRSWFGA